jgi:hypothetical protein
MSPVRYELGFYIPEDLTSYMCNRLNLGTVNYYVLFFVLMK